MKVVADTNIFLAVVMGEPERDAILKSTRDCEVVAPEVLPFEIGNALTAMLRRRAIHSEELSPIWNAVQQIPVELKRIDILQALNIATEHGIYAYDAYFLACAQTLRCPLITLDQRLQQVALAIDIPLVQV